MPCFVRSAGRGWKLLTPVVARSTSWAQSSARSAAGQPVATKPQAAAVKFPSPEAYTPRHPKQQESSDAANEFRKPKATRGS